MSFIGTESLLGCFKVPSLIVIMSIPKVPLPGRELLGIHVNWSFDIPTEFVSMFQRPNLRSHLLIPTAILQSISRRTMNVRPLPERLFVIVVCTGIMWCGLSVALPVHTARTAQIDWPAF